MWLFLIASGWAAERPCGEAEYLSDDFVTWVQAAETALGNDDLIAHGQVYGAMQESIPCLIEPVPSEAWAQMLLGVAVIDQVTGDPWEDALTGALLANPDIDRSWTHDKLQAFAPILPSTDGEPLPEDARHWLDGHLITQKPDLPGIHIAQREYAGVFESELIFDHTYPERWLPMEAPEPLKRGKGGGKVLTISGIAGMAAFSGAALATGLAGAQAQRDFDAERYGTLRTLNNAAIGAAGASGLVAVLGFAL